MSKIIRNTLILTIITVVAGLGLGLVYEVTKEPIARTEEQAKKEAWQAVFSDVSLGEFKPVDVDQDAADKTVSELDIKATVDEVCEAADEGYVVTVTDKEGYGGDIKITVGVTKDGTVSGVSKDGGEGEPIDAISGATITSRAFTGAVNTAIGYCKNAF